MKGLFVPLYLGHFSSSSCSSTRLVNHRAQGVFVQVTASDYYGLMGLRKEGRRVLYCECWQQRELCQSSLEAEWDLIHHLNLASLVPTSLVTRNHSSRTKDGGQLSVQLEHSLGLTTVKLLHLCTVFILPCFVFVFSINVIKSIQRIICLLKVAS